MRWFIILIVASVVWQIIQQAIEKRAQEQQRQQRGSGGGTQTSASGPGAREREVLERRRAQLEELRRRRAGGGTQATARTSETPVGLSPGPRESAPPARAREIMSAGPSTTTDAAVARRAQEQLARQQIEQGRGSQLHRGAQSPGQRQAMAAAAAAQRRAEQQRQQQQQQQQQKKKKRAIAPIPEPPPITRAAAAAARHASADAVTKAAADAAAAQSAARGIAISAALRDPEGLRRAFILKTVLEPPVSVVPSGIPGFAREA